MNDNMTEVIGSDKTIIVGEDNFNIQLKSSNVNAEKFKLNADACWATPSNNENDTVSYKFVKSSCPYDGETSIYNNGEIL